MPSAATSRPYGWPISASVAGRRRRCCRRRRCRRACRLALGGDLQHAVVLRVGDEERALGVDRDVRRQVEVGGDGVDAAVGRDAADAVAAGLGDVERAVGGQREPARLLEARGRGRAAVAERVRVAAAGERGDGCRAGRRLTDAGVAGVGDVERAVVGDRDIARGGEVVVVERGSRPCRPCRPSGRGPRWSRRRRSRRRRRRRCRARSRAGTAWTAWSGRPRRRRRRRRCRAPAGSPRS